MHHVHVCTHIHMHAIHVHILCRHVHEECVLYIRVTCSMLCRAARLCVAHALAASIGQSHMIAELKRQPDPFRRLAQRAVEPF